MLKRVPLTLTYAPSVAPDTPLNPATVANGLLKQLLFRLASAAGKPGCAPGRKLPHWANTFASMLLLLFRISERAPADAAFALSGLAGAFRVGHRLNQGGLVGV